MNIGLVAAILALILILSGQGTRTTKPNPSFTDQVPTVEEIANMPESNSKKAYELFAKLYQENSELADELGRIPDFADSDITDKDLEALVNITDYYFQSKNPKIKEAFRKMLNIGMKDKRAYCSPLEALKWLSEKCEFEEGSWRVNDPLSNYTLPRLLRTAWDFSHEERWSDFREVVNRLNSPELFAMFMNSKFTYKITYYPQRSKITIKTGIGDCKAYAIAAYDCLRNAGYDVYLFSMDYKSMTGHTICVIDMGKELYTLDNNRGLAGPFASREEIMRRFGYEGRISIREYGWRDIMSRFR